MFALDTNTVIHFFKNKGRVLENLRRTPPQEVAIPAPVLYELETGIARHSRPKERRAAVRRLLEAGRLLPFDENCAIAAAEIRSKLERNGEPIGPIDTLIAGTALAYSATLVTHNVREFSRIPGLRLADWFE